MKLRNKILLLGLMLIFFCQAKVALAQVDTTNAGFVAKVAPGELMPISVKLSNFGAGRRVDVEIKYAILTEASEEIYVSRDTMAVETTANFVKTVQVPFDTIPGIYIAKTTISYEGQQVPVSTQFPFTVERKILGLFQDDFLRYAGVIIFFCILMFSLGRLFVKRRNTTRFAPVDYSNIPRQNRIFYELISDTVMGMRQRVGDAALDIASRTNGLVIDEKTGRVLKFTESPSKVVAQLVSGYEKVLGQKTSFFFRKT